MRGKLTMLYFACKQHLVKLVKNVIHKGSINMHANFQVDVSIWKGVKAFYLKSCNISRVTTKRFNYYSLDRVVDRKNFVPCKQLIWIAI